MHCAGGPVKECDALSTASVLWNSSFEFEFPASNSPYRLHNYFFRESVVVTLGIVHLSESGRGLVYHRPP